LTARVKSPIIIVTIHTIVSLQLTALTVIHYIFTVTAGYYPFPNLGTFLQSLVGKTPTKPVQSLRTLSNSHAIMSKPSDNPYQVLSVPRNATASQIKSAYRKLALKYHPDRQTTPEEKERCSQVFVQIGNAYEILADNERREEYDRFGTVGGGGAGRSQSNRAAGFGDSGGFGGFGGFRGFGGLDDIFANDPFFAGKKGGRAAGFSFTDPFELFREAFGDIHGGLSQRGEDDSMEPFSGGMNSMMNDMMRNMSSGGGMQSFSSFSSSTSSGMGGARESISTRTEIVNGKKRTVTERVFQRPDGTVERHVETSGDKGLLKDEYGHHGQTKGLTERQLQQRNQRKWGGW